MKFVGFPCLWLFSVFEQDACRSLQLRLSLKTLAILGVSMFELLKHCQYKLWQLSGRRCFKFYLETQPPLVEVQHATSANAHCLVFRCRRQHLPSILWHFFSSWRRDSGWGRFCVFPLGAFTSLTKLSYKIKVKTNQYPGPPLFIMHWCTEYSAYSSWCAFVIWTMWFESSDVLTSATNLSISPVPSIRLRPWHSMSMHINCSTMTR